jgi:hypothetical protein
VSVLLRQSGGFEGSFSGRVLLDMGDLPVPNTEDPGLLPFLEGDAASSASTTPAQRNHYSITCLNEILRPIPLLVHDFIERGQKVSYAVMASISLGVRKVRANLPLHVGGKEVEDGSWPLLLKRGKQNSHKLHVLLQHRPRSIPQPQESA